MECRQKIESHLQANKSEGVIIRLLDIIVLFTQLLPLLGAVILISKASLRSSYLKNPFKSTFPSFRCK